MMPTRRGGSHCRPLPLPTRSMFTASVPAGLSEHQFARQLSTASHVFEFAEPGECAVGMGVLQLG